MLSLVIPPCGGMSIAITRSAAFCILVRTGGSQIRPGPFAPHERPSTNSTPRSYSLRMRSPENRYNATIARTGSKAPSIRSSSGGERFDDDRRALAAADAGGAQTEALLGAPQRVQQMQRNARAGCGERVADRNRAAMHVRLGAVQPELALDGQILRRECFVHLDQIHLLELHAGLGQRLARRRRRADAHVLGLDTPPPPPPAPPHRLQPPRLRQPP